MWSSEEAPQAEQQHHVHAQQVEGEQQGGPLAGAQRRPEHPLQGGPAPPRLEEANTGGSERMRE